MSLPVEPTDSRVEFFNSQSSFGSSSVISTSRIDFQSEEILKDTESFFETLKQVLRPDPSVNKQEIRMIINRAKIMAKETMPNYIDRINRKRNVNLNLEPIKESQHKLTVLIQDYEKSSQSRADFDFFYEKYSDAIHKFNKKVGSGVSHEYLFPPQPDVVTIVEYSPFRGGNSNYRMLKTANAHFPNIQQSDIRGGTSEQVMELKAKIRQLKQNQSRKDKQVRDQANIRIQNIINVYSRGQDEGEKIRLLEQELSKNTNENIKLSSENNQIREQLTQILSQLSLQKSQNQRLRQIQQSTSMQQNRKQQAQSRISDGNKSIHSEYNQSNEDQIRKLQKLIRNLEYENQLLKNQLKKERDIVYKQMLKDKQEHQKQKNQYKILLDSKNTELRQVKIQLDRYKVESIKLVDQVQKLSKKAELEKISGNNTKVGSRMPIPNQEMEIKKVRATEPDESITKAVIQEYIGDGNENLPYYELLNKQYRIRYRRSCLKEKELLHKNLGLEVGVISQFFSPNEQKLCIYLSNFDNQQQITNLKLKITNSKNNKLILQNSEIGRIGIEQQSKAYLSAQINHYPIGCTVLICQYNFYNKHHQIRILLPIHILKMLKITQKSELFIKPTVQSPFPLQRKIGKDIETISSYFKGCKINNNTIECLIIHEHTQTFFICDFIVENGEMRIVYEHKSGDSRVTEYIIKCVKFLFKREDS